MYYFNKSVFAHICNIFLLQKWTLSTLITRLRIYTKKTRIKVQQNNNYLHGEKQF